MATITRNLTPSVNGVATSFTTPHNFVPASLVVSLNGIQQTDDEYAETSTSTFSMTNAPRIGDTLWVQYEIVEAGETVLVPIVVGQSYWP